MTTQALNPAMFGLYWRTARHLRPRQIADRLVRRWARPAPAPQALTLRPAVAPPTPLAERRAVFAGADRVLLLNREAKIGEDWEPAGLPRLWRYHLHYFDDVASPEFAGWAARWMAANPPERGTGWEPYPLSRRIPNWIAWLLAGHAAPAGMIESLAVQTRSLGRQLEHHLLGNHLLANWRALVFAHCFFESTRASAMARAWSDELDRQLLADGAHQERSPMYHALILTDLLDLIGLGTCYPGLLPAASWRDRAGRMLGWLDQMTHADGGIAFFQDAAFDMAPPPAAIHAYARRLGVRPEPAKLGSSGYARLASPESVVLMDVGTPGPAHQPGHAHAGALSLELSHRGMRFLVNSGTSTYEPGPARSWERSTAAHNTLRLDGRDQSEMWAAFRVGRRAVTTLVKRDEVSVEAAHDGYAPAIHHRRVRLEAGCLAIEDEVQGSGEHLVELFFHLHPDVRLEPGLRCVSASGAAIRLHPPAAASVEPAWVEPTLWRPEFGLQLPNQTVVVRSRTRLPATLHTRIELN